MQSPWKKGQRIAVIVDDDIFLATITRVGKEKLFLEFDDGDTGKVSVGSKRILGLVNNTKRKSPIPKSKLNSYLVEVEKPQVVRKRQSIPKFTDKQLEYLNQYKWDIPSITAFLKLPKYRDLFAFHFSRLYSSYADYNDLKESMLRESRNSENKPIISRLTESQIKSILSSFQKLDLIEIRKIGDGFYIKPSPTGRTRLIGLSWAKLYNYKPESEAVTRSIGEIYNRPGIVYTGD